jgi:hypothetical protein
MKYYVYVNQPNDRARVHREDCSFVRVHGGQHKYDEGHWEEFDTRDAAFAALSVLRKRDSRGCEHCVP